jgi:segregation and condensation protein A
VKLLPKVTLQEMLSAFKDVLARAEMFAHHHVNRERLSVRQRMSDILSGLRESAFMNFTQLFKPEEGRMGVTVTFVAILELMREGLIEIVQSEPYGQIHVRTGSARHLKLVEGGASEVADADAENEAALAQPAQPEEDDEPEDHDVSTNEDNMTPAVPHSDNPDPEASK